MILAKVSLGRIVPLIRQAPQLARPVMRAFIRDSARTLISSSGNVPGLVQVTPPSQGKANAAAKKTGEAAVMRDVYRVYTTPGKVFELLRAINAPAAAAFWAQAKKKQWSQAQAILDRFPQLPDYARTLRAFDDGAEHRARRGPNGRVRGKTPSMLVADGRWIRRYIREKQKLVGLLAASIPAAYNGRFGPLKGIPAWIARHNQSWAGGFVIERAQKDGEIILIGLEAGALNREAQRRFNYVLGYRLKAMQRQLPYLARVIENRIAAQLASA
jgi:hypothetical protein